MTTWRFIAHNLDDLETPQISYPALWDTEEENLQHLESFMNDRKADIGDQLDWVSLDRSAVDAPYHARWGEWQKVKRIRV